MSELNDGHRFIYQNENERVALNREMDLDRIGDVVSCGRRAAGQLDSWLRSKLAERSRQAGGAEDDRFSRKELGFADGRGRREAHCSLRVDHR
jgi:hypothetical protein